VALQTADIIKPLVIGRNVFTEQNRVSSKVDRSQRHRAVNSSEFPDALRSFDEMSTEVCRQYRAIGAFRAAELLARSDFDWRFTGDIGDEEVKCNVLTVHVVINPRLYVARHRVRVQIIVILQHIINTQYTEWYCADHTEYYFTRYGGNRFEGKVVYLIPSSSATNFSERIIKIKVACILWLTVYNNDNNNNNNNNHHHPLLRRRQQTIKYTKYIYIEYIERDIKSITKSQQQRLATQLL